MSCTFNVETRRTSDDRIVSYFTTDRRRARRFSRDSGVRFRRLTGEKQVCYGGGPEPERQIANIIAEKMTKALEAKSTV